MFSVIIPTLQRAPEFPGMLKMLEAHELVGEVLVINNSPDPMVSTGKIRVLNQSSNIFVNPAWNLGVRNARFDYVAIINDDVIFPPSALRVARSALRTRLFGLVVPDRSCFSIENTVDSVRRSPSFRLASSGNMYRGTFMCMRTEYTEIPEVMRIWGGDDWLFAKSKRPVACLVHIPFRTAMGTTTSSPEFQTMRAEEQRICDQILLPLQGSRWWHGPVDVLTRARAVRYRLRQKVASVRRAAGRS